MKPTYLCLWLAILNLVFVAPAFADYGGTLSSLFFDRSPDARAEGLGRVSVTLDRSAFASWSNPAALATSAGLTASFSTSSPYFLLDNGRFSYLSAAYRLSPRFAFGFSRHHFNFGESQTITDETGPEPIAEVTPTESLLTASLAAHLFRDFYLGVNLRRSSLDFAETHSALSFDIGLMKHFLLSGDQSWQQRVTVATSLFNISKVSLSDIGDELPQILRIGAAYRISGPPLVARPKLQSLTFAFHVEYQNVLNSSRFGALRVGGELTLLELVSFRLGYYNEEQIASDFNQTTYGFGLRLPLQTLSDQNIPLEVAFDFVNLSHPNVSSTLFELDDFSTFSFHLNWQL